MSIIALGHRKQVGKDTIAKMLADMCRVNNIPVQHVSFAAKLKDTAYSLFSWAGVQPTIFYEEDPKLKQTFLTDLDMTYRNLLIMLGCKMREIHPDCWAGPLVRDASNFNGVTIISDLRFPNEANHVWNAGGWTIKVTKPDVPNTDDQADCALNGSKLFHQTFVNDGPLDKLYERVLSEIFVPVRMQYDW